MDVLQSRNVVAQPNVTPFVRLQRLLFASGAAFEAARLQMAEFLIADQLFDLSANALFGEARGQ